MASTPSPRPEPDPAAAGGDDLRSDALEPDEDDPVQPRVLVASLGAWWVAVPADAVEAVVRPAPVTPVGGTPRWVAGVAAVRGAVVPVVDVARLSGVERVQDSAAELWWVVVTVGGRSVALDGLRVHQVARVRDPADDPQRADEPAVAPPGLPARGVARLDQENSRGGVALPPAARLLDAAALLDLVLDPLGG